VPTATLGLPEVGANSACSSSEMVIRSQLSIPPQMSAQEQAQTLHVEVLHEAEAERGRGEQEGDG